MHASYQLMTQYAADCKQHRSKAAASFPCQVLNMAVLISPVASSWLCSRCSPGTAVLSLAASIQLCNQPCSQTLAVLTNLADSGWLYSFNR